MKSSLQSDYKSKSGSDRNEDRDSSNASDKMHFCSLSCSCKILFKRLIRVSAPAVAVEAEVTYRYAGAGVEVKKLKIMGEINQIRIFTVETFIIEFRNFTENPDESQFDSCNHCVSHLCIQLLLNIEKLLKLKLKPHRIHFCYLFS